MVERQPVELKLNYHVEYLVGLSDSFLAFHSNGVEGREYSKGEITQDLFDPSKVYKVIGNDRFVTPMCLNPNRISQRFYVEVPC